MENAKWNGKLYVASDVSKEYDTEKKIRKASGRRELRCPDPECKNSAVKYCRGQKNVPYFAHIRKSSCEYEKFDKENTPIIRKIKNILYETLQSRGFNVQLDAKLIPHHYTHLVIECGEKKLAIELTTRNISANRIDFIASEYKKSSINVKWVVINELEKPGQESDLAFIKRFIINETDKRDVIEVELDGKIINQYIVDPHKYEYKGREISSKNYPKIYQESSNASNLTVENGELTLEGFFKGYERWLNTKEKAFEKKVIELENEEKRLAEERAERERKERLILEAAKERKKRELEDLMERYALEAKKKNEERKAQNNNWIQREQHNATALSKEGKEKTKQENLRWIKCKCCGRTLQKGAFAKITTSENQESGVCWKCYNGY